MCECHRIGGPWIAEDPDCVVHGTARVARERDCSALVQRASETSDVDELRSIVDQLATIIENIY